MTSSELPYISNLQQTGSAVYRYTNNYDDFTLHKLQAKGVIYKTNAVVTMKPATDFEWEIYVVNLAVHFYVQVLKTLEYSEHYCTCHQQNSYLQVGCIQWHLTCLSHLIR